MTKPLVTYPDVEALVVAYLAAEVPAYDGPTDHPTVSGDLPSEWTAATPSHLQVAKDGTFTDDHPIAVHATIRVTAWSQRATRADELANLVFGLLCAHPGTGGISAVRPLTGPLPARDTEHLDAELCSITVDVAVRSTALTATS